MKDKLQNVKKSDWLNKMVIHQAVEDLARERLNTIYFLAKKLDRLEAENKELQKSLERITEIYNKERDNNQMFRVKDKTATDNWLGLWHCNRCGEDVNGSNVTYEDTHEGCGGICE